MLKIFLSKIKKEDQTDDMEEDANSGDSDEEGKK